MITRINRKSILFEKKIVSIIAKKLTHIEVKQPSKVCAEICRSTKKSCHANADYELIFDESEIDKSDISGVAMSAIRGTIGLDYFLTVDISSGNAVSLALLGGDIISRQLIDETLNLIKGIIHKRLRKDTRYSEIAWAIEQEKMSRFMITDNDLCFLFSSIDLNYDYKLSPCISRADCMIELGNLHKKESLFVSGWMNLQSVGWV